MLISTQVLIIAKEPVALGDVSTNLMSKGHHVTAVGSGDEAIEQITAGLNPKLVFIDVASTSTGDLLQTMQRLKLTQPHTKVIAICDNGNARQAVEVLRLGAQECLVKPFAQSEFETVLARGLGTGQLADLKNAGHVEDVGEGRFLVTSCPAMSKIRSYCGFVAKVDLPILILGESGTGKEVVARLIHKISPRANSPFLKVNCAAMPADLLESELFGYEPGAFTGATHAKPGKFEQANKGTILLDEIGEMPPNLQAKILHVLQDQQFSRLGGRAAIKADVRILAATNVDVEEALATHKLRKDLYYRLNAFIVRMPPLRERKDEIGLLLEYFTTQHAKRWNIEPALLSPAVMDACKRYPWPGNVRELENFAKRLLVLRDEHAAIAGLTLPTNIHSVPIAQSGRKMVFMPPVPKSITDQGVANLKSVGRSAMGEAEAIVISQALARTHWNRKQAAGLLNISYRALLYKIKQYRLERSFQMRAAGD
jgi:two-component system, NtrC family, response regulator AtoC